MAKIQVFAVVLVLAAVWQHTTAGGYGEGHGAGGGGHAYSHQSISSPVVGEAHKISVSGADGHHGHGKESFDYVAYPKYQNSYAVADGHTGDHHSHDESRDGDTVKGQYQLKEADGRVRTVHYVADKGGYRADVQYSGHH